MTRAVRRQEMRSLPALRGSRYRLTLLAAAAAVGLAACSSTMDDMDSATATGSPFTQALFKDYSDLSHQAAGLPAPPPEEEAAHRAVRLLP